MEHWERVVRESYERMYAPLRADPHCHPPTEKCVNAMFQRANATPARFPWWLRNLMRDARNWYLAVYTVLADASTTPIAACTIAKVGITTWKQHFNKLLRMRLAQNGSPHPCIACPAAKKVNDRLASCYLKRSARQPIPGCSYLPELHADPEWLTFAIVRDPLERFLSGYLDKCVSGHYREGHCMPLEMFRNGTRSTALAGMSAATQLETFVDVFPLHVNRHFFPQAMQCNQLGLSHRNYTFIGSMNETFKAQVRALNSLVRARYERHHHLAPGELTPWERAMEEFPGGLDGDGIARDANGGHSTNAAAKFTTYFTRHSVERLLRYYSIDYVELNLPLPRWLAQY